MKTFETPVVDLKKINVMDILTTSGNNTNEPTDEPIFSDHCVGELPLD